MKYITQLDTDTIKNLASQMPDNSALVVDNDRILALNASVGVWNYSNYGGSLTLDCIKDPSGNHLVYIDKYASAKRLYSIAEPDGRGWHLISPTEQAKYIRMQEAGVRPSDY